MWTVTAMKTWSEATVWIWAFWICVLLKKKKKKLKSPKFLDNTKGIVLDSIKNCIENMGELGE